MTRPPKRDADFKRTRQIAFKVTDDEHDRIRQAAEKTGQNVGQFVRVAALEKAVQLGARTTD